LIPEILGSLRPNEKRKLGMKIQAGKGVVQTRKPITQRALKQGFLLESSLGCEAGHELFDPNGGSSEASSKIDAPILMVEQVF
jgi:hypothetical protein